MRTLGVATAIFLVGCNAAPPPTQRGEKAAAQDVFDVGSICAGEVIGHEFTFTNRTAGELRITKPEDIRVGCGCTSLTPSRNDVPAGESIAFQLKIDTDQLRGAFSYASSVDLTAADGTKHPYIVVVKGTAVATLECKPDVLLFDAVETEAGRTRTFEVVGNQYLRLADWRVTGGEPNFRVDSVTATGERSARVQVSYHGPTDLSVVAGSVQISARIVSSERTLPRTGVSARLAIRAERKMGFTVTPQLLSVAVSHATGNGKATLHLTGANLNPSTIRGVKCGDLSAEWKMTPTSDRAALLTLTFVGIGKKQPSPDAVILDVVGVGDVRVPMVAIQSE